MDPKDTFPLIASTQIVLTDRSQRLTTNTKKMFLFFSPTQLEIQGQWWSKVGQHFWQMLQCLALEGRELYFGADGLLVLTNPARVFFEIDFDCHLNFAEFFRQSDSLLGLQVVVRQLHWRSDLLVEVASILRFWKICFRLIHSVSEISRTGTDGDCAFFVD